MPVQPDTYLAEHPAVQEAFDAYAKSAGLKNATLEIIPSAKMNIQVAEDLETGKRSYWVPDTLVSLLNEKEMIAVCGLSIEATCESNAKKNQAFLLGQLAGALGGYKLLTFLEKYENKPGQDAGEEQPIEEQPMHRRDFMCRSGKMAVGTAAYSLVGGQIAKWVAGMEPEHVKLPIDRVVLESALQKIAKQRIQNRDRDQHLVQNPSSFHTR